MEKQQLVDYIFNSPENTNPAILNQMINELTNGGGSENTNSENNYPVIYLDMDKKIINIDYVDSSGTIIFPNLPAEDLKFNYNAWYNPPFEFYPGQTVEVSYIKSDHQKGIVLWSYEEPEGS